MPMVTIGRYRAGSAAGAGGAAMDVRTLGASGVEISVIGIGGYELGPEPDQQPDVGNAVEVIEAAYDEGVTWLDTSENYLATANESLVGEALSRLGHDFAVCSKVCPYAALTGGA